MQDPIGIPSCFSSGEKLTDDHPCAVTRPGQSVFMSVYRTNLADHSRLITITWCKNLMLHGLSVSVEGHSCKVDLKPWHFWRKQGSKHFLVHTTALEVFWDLRDAKFNGETEPNSDFYVAVVCDQQVVLLLGDLKKEAYRKTNCRPAILDPVMVSKREHIFGKRVFTTRVVSHEVSIECKSGNGGFEPEMEMRVDGHLVIHVKHLQWKFRGNESILVNKVKIEVYWDVHDWLFCPGLRHALFIFKPLLPLSRSSSSSPPLSSSSPLSSQTGMSSGSGSVDGFCFGVGSSEFCLFLYAWKIE